MTGRDAFVKAMMEFLEAIEQKGGPPTEVVAAYSLIRSGDPTVKLSPCIFDGNAAWAIVIVMDSPTGRQVMPIAIFMTEAMASKCQGPNGEVDGEKLGRVM